MVNVPQPPLVGFTDIRTQALDDWQQYKIEGQQYLNLAENAYNHKKKAFTTEILYNIIAMGIEKLVMSGLMEIGQLPYNHTMHDLAAALEEWMPDAIAGKAEQLRALDKHQEICDPYSVTIKIPTTDEIASMLQLARELEKRLAINR